MKLTDELRTFLWRENLKYSKQLAITPPKLIFTDEELKQYVKIKNSTVAIYRKRLLGRNYPKGSIKGLNSDVIFINVDNSDFLWQLVDTVVHELLHLIKPNLRHGKKYQNTINDIIMGNKP